MSSVVTLSVCVVGCFGGGLLLLSLVAVSVGGLLYSGVYCWFGGLGVVVVGVCVAVVGSCLV